MKVFACVLFVIIAIAGCAAPASGVPAASPVATPSSTSPAPSVPLSTPVIPKPPSPPSVSERIIPWERASDYIGQRMTVYGPVVSTNYAERSNGQPTFLNLGRPYPNQGFTVVIWGRDRSKFPPSPEKYYEGKTIYVTGLIEDYRGVPEIIITNPNQIEVR